VCSCRGADRWGRVEVVHGVEQVMQRCRCKVQVLLLRCKEVRDVQGCIGA
jgi:hypothetical protein